MAQRILRHFTDYLAAYLIALIGFLGSFTLFYALQFQEEHHLLNIAQLGLETVENALQAELSFDQHLLKHLARLNLKSAPAPSAQEVIKTYPRLLGLAELSADKRLNWSYLSQSTAIQASWLAQALKKNLPASQALKQFWVSSPLLLPNQTQALFMIYPQGDHYFLALVDAHSLLQHSGSIPGMLFELSINGQSLNSPASGKDENWIYAISKEEDGARWTLQAGEETLDLGKIHVLRHEAPLSWITLIFGILISVLLARSVALSQLLRERTRNLKYESQERLQSEEAKKNLEKALLQGQKLQAIGTLAGGIAHDFNNILYAIRGYVELARDDLPHDSATYKNLGKVLDGTHRGQDLVARILSFSRRQHHELTPLTLKSEINAALDLLGPTIPQSVELHFEATLEGRILGNKTQIHQVMVNLITNAVDAMDGEGKIDIRLQGLKKYESLPPGLESRPDKTFCKIEIQDNGHGMDVRTLERIFEPFFTTKEVGKGTGLGLSTVHSIVKEHNGGIIVNSLPGKGSLFILYFPEQGPAEKENDHG